MSSLVKLSGQTCMMVDDIADVTITNDGATILQLLEVEHPAAIQGLGRAGHLARVVE